MLNVNLTGSDFVAITSTGTTYKLTLGGSQTWVGVNSANLTGNGTRTLTVTAAGLAAFTDIDINDSGTANAVSFNDSGANGYSDNFSVLLNGTTPGDIRLYGTSAFGSGNLSLSTTNSIFVNGPIGSAGTLSLSASDINLIGGSVSTTGDQVYNGPVLLGANTTTTGANVTFNGTVNAIATTELLANGDFETGTLSGWTTSTSGSGNYFAVTPGAITPASGRTTVGNLQGGTTGAVSDQFDVSVQALSQSFTVPLGATQVILSYQMFVSNYYGAAVVNPAGLTVDSGINQHARVDLLKSTAAPFSTVLTDVIQNLFIGSDPGPNPHGYTNYSFDVTAYVQPGTTYKLRFADVETQDFLNVGVDNVSLTASVSAPTRSLTINSAGNSTFGGAVGGVIPLTSLTTDASGTTQINGGSITTSGNQQYHDNATLGLNTSLVTTNSNVTFGGTLNSSGTVRNLSVAAGAGDITVTGIVGGLLALNDVSLNSASNVTFSTAVNSSGNVTQVSGSGTTTFNGGSVGGNVSVTTNAFSAAFGALNVTGTVTATLLNAFSQAGGSTISSNGAISISANQDGSGSEGFSQGSGSALITSSTAANAVSIIVNTAAPASTGNAALALVQTGSGGAVTVNTRRGAISDSNAAALNISTGSVALIGGNAAGGIGGLDALETQVNAIAVSMLATAPGILQISNTGALAIGTVGATAGVTGNLSAVFLTASGLLTIGAGAGEDLVAAGAPITLNVAGAFEDSGSTITGSGLELLGTGNFTLAQSNDVATLAANTVGSILYHNVNGLDIGTVNTVGISTSGGDVVLRAGQVDSSGQLFVNDVINTSPGANGDLLIAGGVVVNAALVLGSGNIDLAGGADFDDIIINSDTSITLSGGTATLQPNRDIIVLAQLQSLTGGLTLNADADNDGVGGVWLNEGAVFDASILAAGALLIQGSNVSATGGSSDSVRVDSDTTPAVDQIVATGSLTIQSKLGVAPVNANVYLDGVSRTTGAGAVTVIAQNSVLLTSQLTSTSGDVHITATTGDVSIVDNGLATAEVLANASGVITIDANGTTTLGSNTTVQSAGGDIILSTNDINIDTANAEIDAAMAGIVTIRNFTSGRSIDVGADTVGSLGITDAELDRITQAAVIRIGRRADGQDSGDIQITAGPIGAENVNTLHLISGDRILDTAAGFITTTNLAAEATNSIVLDTASDTPATPNLNDNNIQHLALRTFNVGADAAFWDADGFVISAIDGLAGIEVSEITQLRSGVESTLSGSDVTQTAPILSSGLQVLGQGNFTFDLASNDIGTLAGNVINSITYSDANTVAVGALTSNTITSVGTSSSSLILTAPTIVVDKSINTTSELGFVILDVTTRLDLNGINGGGAGVDPIIYSLGFVQQTGLGTVELEGKIVTSEDNVSFNGPVKIGTTPGTSASIDTGSAAGGSITFNNTVQGSTASATPTFENLTLNAGTGDILFSSQVGGGGFRLGVLTVQSARHTTTNVGVSAREFKQVAGTGETKLNGFVQTNQPNGIDVTSNYITFNGSIQTTNGGTVKITNASDFQLVPGTGAINADGAVTQTGAGLSLVGGDIVTTDDVISFASDTYISNSPVTMNAGLGNVSFSKLLQVNNKTLTLRDGNSVDLGTRTTIANGTLNVYVGPSGTTPGSLAMASGALFTGTGTVNSSLNVGSGATLAPSTATTLLGTGILTFTGDVNLASASVYSVELNTATAGTGYDQIVVNGAGNEMNITAGAVLQATRFGSFNPTIGTALKILDGTNAVNGSFTGAANGSTLFLNGAYFTVSYNSPTGDIVLTSAAAPGGAAKIIDNDELAASQYSATTNNGTLTFSPLASWSLNTVSGRGFTNDLRFAAATSNPAGTAFATYTFNGLVPGSIYRVSATWFELSNRATNAKFTVSTGLNGSANVLATVNQRLAPNSFTASSAKWQDLSTAFTVGDNGSLTVTLSNYANGYVVADAIRIEAQSSAGPEVQVVNSSNGNADLPNNSGTVDFGTTIQSGDNSGDVSRTVTIKNIGSTALMLGSATLTAPAGYQIVGYVPTSLAAGDSLPVTIKLLSATTGNFSGSISFQTNDSDENPFTFHVSGCVVSNKVWVVDNTPNTGSDLVIGAGVTGTYSESGIAWNNSVDPGVGFMQDLRTANAGVASTATWNFIGLVTGLYRVSICYRAETNRASNASFTVDGGTSTPVSVNQRNSPNDFLSSGVYWEDLVTSYAISGTTLTVTLNGAGSNGYVIADAVRIERISPLQAAGGPATNTTVSVLSAGDLEQAATAAALRWQAFGLSPIQQSVLASLVYEVSDLPGAYLGGQTEGSILIDTNAAGYGWYVDATPADDVEFGIQIAPGDLAASQLDAASHIDLLTVLMHEIGHRLGLDDIDVGTTENTLMTESIQIGTRRLPESVLNLPVSVAGTLMNGDAVIVAPEDSVGSEITDDIFYAFGVANGSGGVNLDGAMEQGRQRHESDPHTCADRHVPSTSIASRRAGRAHRSASDISPTGLLGRLASRLLGRKNR